MPSHPTEFVYFVQARPGGLVKIGYTAGHPDRRLEGLRAVSPVPIDPLGVLRGDRRLERKLHLRFRPYLHHSEWFEPATPLVEFIHAKVRPWPHSGPIASMQDPAGAEAEYQAALADLIDWALHMRYERDQGRPLRLLA